jgi:hypothetical protein
VSGASIRRAFLVAIVVVGIDADPAAGQTAESFEIGAQITWVRDSELDSTDAGIGGRASWLPSSWIGVEGEITFFPSDIPDRTAVSRHRLEGLFGITAGPRLGPWRPFARIRPGFLRVAASPEPVACILIFPPPLSCALAAGDTFFTVDLGGGVEVLTPGRTFVRFDLGDRLVRYPGPAIERDGQAHDDSFIGHDVRAAVGAGWRF